MTKAQGRNMVRQWLDDPNAKRWSDPNIDLAIQLSIDGLWGDLLDQAPYLTRQVQTIVPFYPYSPNLGPTSGGPTGSPAAIDLRLTANGGQLTQRFYRIQHLVANSREYYAKDPRDYLISLGDAPTPALVEARYTYQVLGDQVWVHPPDSTVELTYSFKPTPFTAMTDGMNIPWPEGSEDAYIMLAAASTMAKGNAEDAAQLIILANIARDRMLNAVRRQYHGMTQPFTTGTSPEWGGT